MKLTKTLGLAVLGATLATGASALDSKYTDVQLHGSAHHHHSDGDWHGIAPHTHNGVATHRGHSHTPAPVSKSTPAPQPAPIAFVTPQGWYSCGLSGWRDNDDLQRCRVKQVQTDHISFAR